MCKGQQPLAGFGVRYFDAAGTDITRGVRLGTYRTAPIAPRGEAVVRLEVEVRANAAPGASITRRIKAFSSVDPRVKDAVTATVTEGAAPEVGPPPDVELTPAAYAGLAPAIICELE